MAREGRYPRLESDGRVRLSCDICLGGRTEDDRDMDDKEDEVEEVAFAGEEGGSHGEMSAVLLMLILLLSM